MTNIEIKDFSKGDIEICRDLCEELMRHQASQAIIRTDVLQAMTFDNRLKPSFENAQNRKLVLAFDGEKPIGYAFAEVADITDDLKYYVPDWAKTIYENGHLIFFPEEQELPTRLGTFNNLYIKPEYQGLKLGYQLSKKVMDWMKSMEGVTGIYVYVSNGNNEVVDFYERFGFEYSHQVLGGFITAYALKI